MMNFCYVCGQELPLGRENFCPNCGEKFETPRPSEQIKGGGSSIVLDGTKGSAFGFGTSGTGNVIGKEIEYTVEGNIINLHVNSLSTDVIKNLKKMMSVETQLPSMVDTKEENKRNITNLSDIKESQEKITNVLDHVKQIEKKEGTQIEKINVGELQVFKKDLLVKDALTKASIFYYTGQYTYALEWYEKVLVLDPKKADVWYNKGVILAKLERFRDAIKGFDRAIEIKPDYAEAWYNKGVCLGILGKHRQAIKCFDKVRTIGMLVKY